MMVPKIEDLSRIKKAIEKEFEEDGMPPQMEITFFVNTAILNRINKDMFYRNNTDGTPEENPDEVRIKTGNITFRYTKQD